MKLWLQRVPEKKSDVMSVAGHPGWAILEQSELRNAPRRLGLVRAHEIATGTNEALSVRVGGAI